MHSRNYCIVSHRSAEEKLVNNHKSEYFLWYYYLLFRNSFCAPSVQLFFILTLISKIFQQLNNEKVPRKMSLKWCWRRTMIIRLIRSEFSCCSSLNRPAPLFIPPHIHLLNISINILCGCGGWNHEGKTQWDASIEKLQRHGGTSPKRKTTFYKQQRGNETEWAPAVWLNK